MTNKDIDHIDWNGGTDGLVITMVNALSGGDKTILDGIVAAVDDYPINLPTREYIMTEILTSVTSTEQLLRLLDALDKYPSFSIILDSKNYPLADTRMQLALAYDDITTDDYAMISAMLPDWSPAY